MRFGPRDLVRAEGAILAHGYRLPSGTLRKGQRLDAGAVDALRRAGVREVVVAEPGPGDVLEDAAALRVGRAAAGDGVGVRAPFAGRCNLVAEADGVAVVDASRVGRANAVDEALTLATLAPFARVEGGDLVATTKVIPLAVPEDLVERCAGVLAGETPAVSVAPFLPHRAGLVLTTLPGTREALLAGAERLLRARLESAGSELGAVRVAPHGEEEVAVALRSLLEEGHDPVLVLGASAVVDRADVVPRAVERAGGVVERLGLPVDPGNLLLLARRGGATILGAPGCARSPRRSGFDHVLERVLAGLELDAARLAGMGVGGLLAEIPSRPQPREPRRPRGGGAPAVAALVLAAGLSRRMGERNKLLEEVEGVPLVSRVVDALLASRARPVVVVTGHDEAAVSRALRGRRVRLVHNPRHARGMSGSLRAGVAALGEDVDGVLIALGDMPRVRPADVDALLDAFQRHGGRRICIPVHRRKRGHPVLLPSALFREVEGLRGDVGAREVVARNADLVLEVPVEHSGVLVDVDTRMDLEALRTDDAGTPPPVRSRGSGATGSA